MTVAESRGRAKPDMLTFSRSVAFYLFFAAYWITVTPFIDLRDPSVLLAQTEGDPLQQAVSLLMLALSIAVLWRKRETALAAVPLALICVLLWQCASVVYSAHPDLSIRRAVLNLAVITSALAWLFLPENDEHFRRLLRNACLFTLGLAYFGVVFLPEVSIHNLDEALELVNAGSWRGHFAHKNIAGPAMVFMAFYGLYLYRPGARLGAGAIVILASIFLYNTNNKTSIGLVVLALIVTAIVARTRSFWAKFALVVIPVAAMGVLTVGSVVYPSVREFLESVSSDPTYTNRNAVWRFALDHLSAHPWLGYGFEAFWKTPELVNGGYDTWAAGAGHAHNSYLNVAMTMGLIGMALAVWWLVWRPLVDFHRCQQNGDNDRGLAVMYLRIWMFILLYANLETAFFVGRGAVWFGLLGAVFGLRLHARASQKVAQAPAAPPLAPALAR